MSNFMQIGDAQNDIVLIENNVSDNQLTTTLTKANGQPISSPPVTLPSGGGTTVVANPTLSGSEAELTGLEVAGTKYKVPQGGGGIVAVDILPTASQAEYEKHLLYLQGGKLYYLSSETQYKLVTATDYIPADELLGTWLFNENVNLSNWVDTPSYDVTFTSDSIVWKYLSIRTDGSDYYMLYGNDETSQDVNLQDEPDSATNWNKQAYRTITITDTSSLTNREEFTTWLKANATKQ